MASHFEGKGRQKQENKPRQHKRTENIEDLGKAVVGMTKIERSKTQNQRTTKQTKQTERIKSNR
jgi:hypothetical protein